MWWHIQDYTAATEMQGLRFQSSERCQKHLHRKAARQQSRAGDGEMPPPLHLQPAGLHPCGKQSREAETTTGISTPQRTALGVGAAESSLSNVAVPGGACAMGLEEVRTEKPRGVSVSAPPGSGESSALQEAPPRAAGSSAWNREGPGEDHDSHQRTQKEAYESLNKSPHLTITESDMEEDAEFVSVMKLAPF